MSLMLYVEVEIVKLLCDVRDRFLEEREAPNRVEVLTLDVALIFEPAFDHGRPVRVFECLGREWACARVGAGSFDLPHEADGTVVREFFVPIKGSASEFGVELVPRVMVSIDTVNPRSGGGDPQLQRSVCRGHGDLVRLRLPVPPLQTLSRVVGR